MIEKKKKKVKCFPFCFIFILGNVFCGLHFPSKPLSMYESLEGIWRFSPQKAVSKSLHQIVQSVHTD